MTTLEEKYTHTILLTLLDKPKQRKTEFLQSISRSSSMSKRLDELVDAGLVESVRDTFDYNTKWISLTQRGRDVAIMLKCIYQIMDDSKGFKEVMGMDSEIADSEESQAQD